MSENCIQGMVDLLLSLRQVEGLTGRGRELEDPTPRHLARGRTAILFSTEDRLKRYSTFAALKL